MTLKREEPQLTMTNICSLEDLAPFFAAICNDVTRQQTRHETKNNPEAKLSNLSDVEKLRRREALSSSSSLELVDAILERDFIEPVTKQ